MKKKISPHRQRLSDTVKRLGLTLPQVQILLVQERFLERLVTVDRKHQLIWKGGSLLLRRYSAIQPPRFTTDLDFLVRGQTVEDAIQTLNKSAQVDLEDGFAFTFKKQVPMKRDTPYGGERLEISWSFDGKPNSEPLRIDLCAGDDVDAVEVKLDAAFIEPSGSPSLSILVYPSEFIFAEKIETVARFGTGNTRLKDFIDLWTLIQTEMNPAKLQAAIDRCHLRRGSEFDLAFLRNVLSDQRFSDELERARGRNYPTLNVPTVSVIFSDLVAFLKRVAE